VTGAVTGPDGAPLGGVQVVVAAGDFTARTATLTTGTPGGYTVTDIPTPGAYTVTFSLDGYVSETRQAGFVVPATVSGVSVQVRRADASIRGTVSGGGRSIAGATVELTDGELTRSTTTAANPSGGYVFTNIPPGSYTLSVTAPGFSRRVVLVGAGAGDAVVRDVALSGGP
jgi:carboxypeptidase family protein